MHDVELHAELIGRPDSRRQLHTPALVVDLEALDRNIDRMAQFARSAGIQLRPHTKTHKSPDIARRQVKAGAAGLCCVKIGEAEVLADASLTDLLITSPVVSPAAITRLIALAGRVSGLTVVVDNPGNALQLEEEAARMDTSLGVIIDIDPGSHRTGVTSADAALSLARTILGAPSLRYEGVQFYCGPEQHIQGFAERRSAIAKRTDYLRTVIDRLRQNGAPPAIVTGGGTGTHQIDAALGLFTELQVGSYVFMDEQYLACEFEPGTTPFETSLFIDTRVVSANAPGMVTVDGGLKAFASDAGVPAIVSGAPPGACYGFMGDEHGLVTLPHGTPSPRLGDVITMTAPHCDPTVNLYDTFHVVQSGVLRELWPVSARGRSR